MSNPFTIDQQVTTPSDRRFVGKVLELVGERDAWVDFGSGRELWPVEWLEAVR